MIYFICSSDNANKGVVQTSINLDSAFSQVLFNFRFFIFFSFVGHEWELDRGEIIQHSLFKQGQICPCFNCLQLSWFCCDSCMISCTKTCTYNQYDALPKTNNWRTCIKTVLKKVSRSPIPMRFTIKCWVVVQSA